jgi:ribosomal protein S18 acetylase RimI-like enzyme
MAVKGLMSLLAEGMSVENLKRIGMLTDESAKKPRSVKLAQDKYKTFYENNDQFRAREEGSILNPQIVQRGLLDDRRIIMPEDIENTVLVPHKGDISGTDVTLTNIGGFELPVPVTSRGGARYPNSPLTPEGNYWASMKTGAAPFQNKAEGLMQALDMDATGVYTAMGREANYFNQAFADGMLQWAQSMKLPKEMVKKFDDDLRKSKPEWVGLDSPEARDQLLGIGNFKPEGAGKFRSAFTKKMSKAEYRDLGFPTITDIEKAFIDPDLAGTALGEAGFTMGRVGKGFDLNRNTNHPSYDTGIGGKYIGGFEQSVPPQIMYPDAYKKLEGVMTKPKSDKPPRLLYDAEKVDAIAKRKDLFQIADARWVDTVSKWLEENKGASLQAAIMAVGIPAALAPQEADASVAKLAARGMELVDLIDPEDSRVGEYFLRKGDDTKSIGSLRTDYAIDSGFGDGYMSSLNTEIAPDYRRQGLAGEMYDAAEEISGNKLVPSTHLSMDGAYMWNARNPELLKQVHEKMSPENYNRVEDILYPDGRGSGPVKLAGFDRAHAVPAAGLLTAVETAEPREYREAPVVQEQSFGDMVNEYAQINQRAQAAEAQKFDTLMAESSNRAGMNRKQRRDNPISQGLMDYSQSQMIPNVKQVGSGFFEGLMDYAKDTMGRGYIASPSYASPQYSDINRQMMANPAQQAPLTPEQVYLDPRDPNALAKAEQARRAGQGLAGLMTLFSPI